ncbi:unnamed protein product [Diamesa serratosioi]
MFVEWNFILLTLIVCHVDSAKILGVFPYASKSHSILGQALFTALAKNGHEVTYISPFPMENPPKNYRDIPLTNKKLVEIFQAEMDNTNDDNVWEIVTKIYAMGVTLTNFTVQHPKFQQLIASKQQFDVIILEVFMTEALLGLGHVFNAPVIGVSTFGASKWTNDLVGSPTPLSYVPHPFLSFTDKMSFVERTGNIMMSLFESIYMATAYDPQQKQIYETSFPDPKPCLNTLKKDVSLVLLNSHFTLNYPRPYVPNMIEVGGMHINRVPNPLPPNIKDYLDNAKDGVIYFSLGSNVQSSKLPVEKRDALLKTFASLKQKVMWKWEDGDLPGKPDNVFIQSWWPQDDILAHPNVKVFITHGGLLGSTEAIYHGVPVVGIPIFGDQELNMARAVRAEYGLMVKYNNLTQTALTWALKEMLDNPKYNKNAKLISSRYRDQPKRPLDTAIYWVEYVARHKGAPHMHSAGQDLGFIQYHNLDILSVVLLFNVVLIYLLMSCCCKKSTKTMTPIQTKKGKKSN